MESYIGNETVENIGINKFQKMVFVFNALEDGWTVVKKEENYIFKKKHCNDKEIFLDSYLKDFIHKNSNIKNIIVKKENNK